MTVKVGAIIAQLRTTDLESSIDFWTRRVGFELAFRYGDFYAGIRAGTQIFHLKHVDAPDPSIADVRSGGHFHLYLDVEDAHAAARALAAAGVAPSRELHDTPWGTLELVFLDDQGHTIHVGQRREN